MSKLTPPDKKQCQAEKQVGAFTLGGRIGERTRCTNKPTVIAKEKEPGEDGLRGSMSLCNPCKAAMIKQCGEHFATFKPIAKEQK